MSLASSVDASDVGFVVIGRNEGERLRGCFDSLIGYPTVTVYVDSGSSDGSIDLARSRDVDAISLSMEVPFTAARARNRGLDRLRKLAPTIRYVQFVDGDCAVIEGWVAAARSFLDGDPKAVCVCGQLRERWPERSIYNRLCDAEWNRPLGRTFDCGGIAMMRVDALIAVAGFRDDMIVGEEAELCARLGTAGGTIWRIARPMAWHDAAMTRFGQWWTRTKRGGFASANHLYLGSIDRHREGMRRLVRPWIWAFAVPLTVALSAFAWGPAALGILVIYPAQLLRTAFALSGPSRWRLERSFFLTLGNVPELLGQLQFWIRRRAAAAASASLDYKS